MTEAAQASGVRLHFDAQQPHQLAAVEAVADLLRGQPRARWGAKAAQALLISESRLLDNLSLVRARHGLEPVAQLDGHEASVEMETGTGKTYVYLRTLRELNRRYGFDRFVIVVPSVAIREGLLQQARQMGAHFAELYPETSVETRVYRPGRDADTRRFAFDTGVQVLVLNIDAFNKRQANLIHRPTDGLRGHRPIDLIAGRRPIVILDEPQNMEGPKAQQALASLAPLLTLRYSATHRRLRNLVYRLDPVQAYDLGLVKRIEVTSVVAEQEGPPPIEVKSIRATTRGVTATLVLEVAGPTGPVRASVKVKGEGEALDALSERSVYQGWVVSAVDADAVRFTNGAVIQVGAVAAPEARDEVMRQQLEETIRAHLEAELRIRALQSPPEQMKVLSLIFLDRVANYLGDDGAPGPVQRWFDAAYARLSSRPRFAQLRLPPVSDVRAAYFSQRRGQAVDTTGRTRDDDSSYTLIMQDKARLLSLAEPVRFIFSHSALREGWDNPNVFQICTLHRTRSELRKRQEIGRGLRLPVMVNGRRCHDRDLARLTVIANETYESFARRLQAEIREECAVEFGARVVDTRSVGRLALRDGWQSDRDFKRVWATVGRAVEMANNAPSETIKAACVGAVAALPGLKGGVVVARRAALSLDEGGVSAVDLGAARETAITLQAPASVPLPNPLDTLQRETGLTRRTLVDVLLASGRLESLREEPVAFLDAVCEAIRGATQRVIADHASYRCTSESPDPKALFEARGAPRAGTHLVAMSCAIYDGLTARDSKEAAWLAELDQDSTVTHVLRWPAWHRVPCPVGPLDLGWIVARGESLTCFLPKSVTSDIAAKACATAICSTLGLTISYRSFD
jgi:type III restriction enzyme